MRQVLAFQCDLCHQTYTSVARMAYHEAKACPKNPACRGCKTCARRVQLETPAGADNKYGCDAGLTVPRVGCRRWDAHTEGGQK